MSWILQYDRILEKDEWGNFLIKQTDTVKLVKADQMLMSQIYSQYFNKVKEENFYRSISKYNNYCRTESVDFIDENGDKGRKKITFRAVEDMDKWLNLYTRFIDLSDSQDMNKVRVDEIKTKIREDKLNKVLS